MYKNVYESLVYNVHRTCLNKRLYFTNFQQKETVSDEEDEELSILINPDAECYMNLRQGAGTLYTQVVVHYIHNLNHY